MPYRYALNALALYTPHSRIPTDPPISNHYLETQSDPRRVVQAAPALRGLPQR